MVCVITGDIGAGKSTVCRDVVERMRRHGYTCDGIVTEKRDPFLVVRRVSDGSEAIIAERKRAAARPGLSRYDFRPGGFIAGNEMLNASVAADLLVIDEAGALELEGGGFSILFPLVENRTAGAVLLVIRKKLLHRYKKRLHCQYIVFEVTEDSRDRIGTAIVSCLKTTMHP
ncbi:hypothetical protein JXO52_00850 [bacterium]|nr:hypothetical protein [bacterium]